MIYSTITWLSIMSIVNFVKRFWKAVVAFSVAVTVLGFFFSKGGEETRDGLALLLVRLLSPDLYKTVTQAQREIDALTETIHKRDAEIKRLQLEVSQTRGEVTRSSQENARLRGMTTDQRTEIALLRRTIEERDKEIKRLRELTDRGRSAPSVPSGRQTVPEPPPPQANPPTRGPSVLPQNLEVSLSRVPIVDRSPGVDFARAPIMAGGKIVDDALVATYWGPGAYWIIFDLQEKYTELTAAIGATDDARDLRVTFRILLDGRQILEQERLSAGNELMPIRVAVNGGRALKLEIEPLGRGGSLQKFAVWARPRLLGK